MANVKTRGFARMRAGVLGGLLIAATAMLPSDRARANPGDWSMPGGDAAGSRYSGLTQITAANVGGLVPDFSFSTGVRATHEGAPLVVGSVMYVVGPLPNHLFALDLKQSGKVLWVFDPHANPYARGVACCDIVNRGPVFAAGKIIYNVLDGTTVAVGADTGREIWRTKLADPTSGTTMTMAPLVAGNRVIVGNAGGELGIRGWVAGLDLETGREVWRAYSTGPDADVLIGPRFKPHYAKDQGTDLGVSSWGNTLWKQGGGTVWGWLTYDPRLHLFYHGTANPGVWNPDLRPGDNKWGATIFARDPDTGEAVWAYQLTPHDGWDFDAINEDILADLPIGGSTRHVAVHFNKNGFAYTLDRATGEVLVAQPFGHVTWADHVDLATGAPVVRPGMLPRQGKPVSGICPTALGAKDWEPAAFSPATRLFYVPAINLCETLETLAARYIAGTPFLGADLGFAPGPGGNMGELVAWDAASGKRVWSVAEPLPVYSGVLATAGGVVFYGTLDGMLKAVDAKSGAALFKTKLSCGIAGSPISFLGPDGKQRIAVYSGLGWLAGGFAGGACAQSGAVHVFKLP